MYRTEERLEKIALSFCILAIFVGCLGLFGLSALIVEQRTKEIGIRKVMGATNSSILHLVSKEFILLLSIANIVAWPVAYLGLNRWLQNFAYQAGIGWWIFLLAGLIGLFIALSTVGFQTIKAARTNPIESLKYE
jgi:putative ABC transport system permease protein